MRRYFREVLNVDPDDIWLHLCLGLEEAKLYYRAFLRAYVQDSERKFPILGPSEYEYRLTVTAAATVAERWRQLIAMADSALYAAKDSGRDRIMANPQANAAVTATPRRSVPSA